MASDVIYKALRADEVAPSEAAGVCRAAIDAADGYVHLSTPDQIAETLALHFRGESGTVLLRYAASDIEGALKWEPSRGGQLFPHYFADLPLDLATARWTLETGPDGAPTLPEGL